MVRYLELMKTPIDARVLGPMILKEIHYRLLLSSYWWHVTKLRWTDAVVLPGHSVDQGKFSPEPLLVGQLAQVAGMSQSSFHSDKTWNTCIRKMPVIYNSASAWIAAHSVFMLVSRFRDLSQFSPITKVGARINTAVRFKDQQQIAKAVMHYA